MEQMRILIVENDDFLRRILQLAPGTEAYRIFTANTGEAGIKKAAFEQPQILLLSPRLPDMAGIEFLKKLRSWSEIPVMVVSERCSEWEKIEFLDAGADDYVVNPFFVGEFLARLRVIQRRLLKKEVMSSAVFTNGKLRIAYSSGCAFMNDRELHLTPIEYKLLCLFAQNLGKVLTHQYITQNVWGGSWENNVISLRVFMTALRKKLENAPDSPAYIQTHIGVGYRMVQVDAH